MKNIFRIIGNEKFEIIITKYAYPRNEEVRKAFMDATGPNPTEEQLENLYNTLPSDLQKKWDAFVEKNGTNIWVTR